jgi:hypothetical protein
MDAEAKTMRYLREAIDLTAQAVVDGDVDENRPLIARAIAIFLNHIGEYEDPYLEFPGGKMVYVGGFQVLALKVKEAGRADCEGGAA